MDESARSVSGSNLELAVDIVAAYVSNNPVPASDLSRVLSTVYAALSGLGGGGASREAGERVSQAQVRRSISPDHLISFEDGKPYKTLRRHLTLRGLTPEAYREKWGLPRDYPMTAQTYSAQRSELARALGLGQQRRRGAAADEAPAGAAAPARARGRKKGAAPDADA